MIRRKLPPVAGHIKSELDVMVVDDAPVSRAEPGGLVKHLDIESRGTAFVILLTTLLQTRDPVLPLVHLVLICRRRLPLTGRGVGVTDKRLPLDFQHRGSAILLRQRDPQLVRNDYRIPGLLTKLIA
jgi:hypothetical protein